MRNQDPGHLRIADYVSATRRPDGTGLIARDAHLHLVAVCADCAAEWHRLGDLRRTYLERLRQLPAPPPPAPHPDELLATATEIELHDAATADLLREYRHILNQKAILLRTPSEQRAARIRRARCRYRSPLLAEMLIDECRRRVRTAPTEAAEIAALVPLVLAWTEDTLPSPACAAPLLARAAAHHANALRVAGDLPAADRVFAQLGHRLAERPLADPRVAAEICSLEASFCIDTRRLDMAQVHLRKAALGFRAAGDSLGATRTAIQLANLLGIMGRPRDLLQTLTPEIVERARDDGPLFYVAAITARANALCDLDAATAAGRLLDQNLDAFEASEDVSVGAILRCLRGRVALGQGDPDSAEQAFRDASDAFLALDRGYDAAMVTLYRAEALLKAGKNHDLAELARGLVAAFRSRGVAGETLAALQLFTQAVAEQTVSSQVVSDLRRRLQQRGGASRPL